jgi:hypothetical protein
MPILDLLRLTGFLGLLAAILYPTCVFFAALLASSRYRSHQRTICVLSVVPALIGLCSRLVDTQLANLRMERDGNLLFAGDLANAYSQFDLVLAAGLGTSSLCFLLLAITYLRDTTRTATPTFLALVPTVLLGALCLQTANLRTIHQQIYTSDAALIADLLPYDAKSYGTSTEFAATHGPLAAQYRRVNSYALHARNSSLVLLLLALAAWAWNRHSERKLRRQQA